MVGVYYLHYLGSFRRCAVRCASGCTSSSGACRRKTMVSAVLGSDMWVERLGTTSASREDMGVLEVVAWSESIKLIPLAKALLIEEPDDRMEEDDGLVLLMDALIPLEKHMLAYRVTVTLVRSEDTAESTDRSSDDDDGGSTDGGRRDRDPGAGRDGRVPRRRSLRKRTLAAPGRHASDGRGPRTSGGGGSRYQRNRAVLGPRGRRNGRCPGRPAWSRSWWACGGAAFPGISWLYCRWAQGGWNVGGSNAVGGFPGQWEPSLWSKKVALAAFAPAPETSFEIQTQVEARETMVGAEQEILAVVADAHEQLTVAPPALVVDGKAA